MLKCDACVASPALSDSAATAPAALLAILVLPLPLTAGSSVGGGIAAAVVICCAAGTAPPSPITGSTPKALLPAPAAPAAVATPKALLVAPAAASALPPAASATRVCVALAAALSTSMALLLPSAAATEGWGLGAPSLEAALPLTSMALLLLVSGAGAPALGSMESALPLPACPSLTRLGARLPVLTTPTVAPPESESAQETGGNGRV